MRSPLRRFWTAQPLWFGVSLLMIGLLAVSASRAAFASTTDNSANGVGAGIVDLVGDRPGRSLLELSTLAPNQTVVNCIVIDNSTPGDPGIVRVYSGGLTDSGNLADYLNLTIEEGIGGSFGDCVGFVAQNTIVVGNLTDFDTAYSDYATGAGFCSLALLHSMTYRITVTLDVATPNAQQGEAVGALAFIWEARSG